MELDLERGFINGEELPKEFRLVVKGGRNLFRIGSQGEYEILVEHKESGAISKVTVRNGGLTTTLIQAKISEAVGMLQSQLDSVAGKGSESRAKRTRFSRYKKG